MSSICDIILYVVWCSMEKKMNDKENKKYKIIEKIEKGEITRKEAAFELSITIRQIDRLRTIYKEFGEKGFIHKGRGRNNVNKKSKEMIEELKHLYLGEYNDYNFVAFYEEIIEKERKIQR